VAGNLAKKDPKNEEFNFSGEVEASKPCKTDIVPIAIFQRQRRREGALIFSIGDGRLPLKKANALRFHRKILKNFDDLNHVPDHQTRHPRLF
jgi:hypothetical protein